MDLRPLLMVSEAVTRSGLLRKESRGAHFRDDFPAKDERQAKFNTVIRLAAEGEMQVEQVPIVEMSGELQQLVEEMG